MTLEYSTEESKDHLLEQARVQYEHLGIIPETDEEIKQSFQIGDILDIFVKPDNLWYKATIVRITDHGPFVHYHGLDESRDEYFMTFPGKRVMLRNKDINLLQKSIQALNISSDTLVWVD